MGAGGTFPRGAGRAARGEARTREQGGGAGVSPAMAPIADVSVIGTTVAPPRRPMRSLRARIHRAAEARRLSTAPNARPIRGPNVWETQPAAGPPTAVPPTNSSEYT